MPAFGPLGPGPCRAVLASYAGTLASTHVRRYQLPGCPRADCRHRMPRRAQWWPAALLRRWQTAGSIVRALRVGEVRRPLVTRVGVRPIQQIRLGERLTHVVLIIVVPVVHTEFLHRKSVPTA